MPVMIGLGVAGLATSIVGGLSSAQAQANSAEAQAAQAQINQKWSNWNAEYNRIQQLGNAGLAEFNRLYRNRVIEEDSLRTMIQQINNSYSAQQYATAQYSRQSRQIAAQQTASLNSRGMGRGGTSEAIARQQQADAASDFQRISVNAEAQRDAYRNQRNAALAQRNMSKTGTPPAYIPSTPIPSPDTSGIMTGALFSALGQGLGGVAGMMGAMQPAAAAAPAASTQAMAPGAVSTQPYNGGAAVGIGTGSGWMPLGFGGN